MLLPEDELRTDVFADEALRTVVPAEEEALLRTAVPDAVLPLRTDVPEAVVREAPAEAADERTVPEDAEDALRATLVAELRAERTAVPAEAVPAEAVPREDERTEEARVAELLRVTLAAVPPLTAPVREVRPPRPSLLRSRVVAEVP